MTTKTWIITGVSQGFGRALAEFALQSGDSVVGAGRCPESVADLQNTYRDRFAAVEFDVCDTSGAARLIQTAVDRLGRLDVLVNNAGRGLVGAAEEVGDSDLRDLMDLNFFGPASLVRAALPVMRAQASGCIVQMSSQGGRLSFPGVGAYSATKFALEGWSEALAGEVASFGIRVMIVEPSRFRTAFNAPDVLGFANISPVYRDMLAPVRDNMTEGDGIQEGDPVKAAEIMFDLVHGEEMPLRLPLGREAVERISASYRRGLDEVERWVDTAQRADFAGTANSVRPF